jgi:hypothetical protein
MENIKISDCFDNIDPVELDNIETGENINNEASVQRIKEIALNAINGQADLTDTNKKAASSKKVKIAALITAAALILSTTVYAMGSIGAFEMFFPDSMKVIDSSTQSILAKVEQNGVTMTVEKAINDGKSAVISYSFSKNDGSAFKSGLTTGKVKLTEIGAHDIGYSNEHDILIDDNKKLVGFICPQEYSSITEKNLTFSVTDLITRQTREKEAAFSLKELLNDKKVINVELIPDSVPGFALEEVKSVNGKISFKTTFLRDTIGDYESFPHISYIKNIKTGATIRGDAEYNFDIAHIADLSEWKPVITYSHKEVIVSGTWDVPIRLESSDRFIGKNGNITISSGDKEIVISKVSASTLGVYFEGYIKKMDGTKIPMTSEEINYTEKLLNHAYVVLNNGKKQIIELSSCVSSSDPD